MTKLFMTGYLLVITTLIAHSQSNGTTILFTEQNIANAILNFQPVQRESVTNQRFEYAKRILADTKSATKDNSKNLNAADYWNITTAFVVLKEPKVNIKIAFSKAIQADTSTICSYIKTMGLADLDKIIPEIFLPFYANCLQDKTTNEASLNLPQYATTNKLDFSLVSSINTISINDQKFRKEKPVAWDRQKPLDIKNQHLIDSLYNVYKYYIGRGLVGKQFETVMWAVVQHSSLEIMEKYLPVIYDGMLHEQLDKGPLKMLLDRIYWLKYNYQIFGSQVGVRLADEKIRANVIKKYKLD